MLLANNLNKHFEKRKEIDRKQQTIFIERNKMNKVELSKQLQSMGISPNKYSLEGSVATWDTIVLVKNYNIWKVLYIDERGNQNELASFKTENDACKFIYNEFK